MNKRDFIKNVALAGMTAYPAFKKLDQLIPQIEHLSAQEVAKDEYFWAQIRAGYRLKPDYINLENGYYCITPQETLENYIHHIRNINYQGSHYMRTVQWDNKKSMQKKLGEIAGCDETELVITRNTTESLDLIISGMHWKEGDEAVMADQDYGAMLNQFKYVAARYGVVNKRVSVPLHPESDEEIVKLYEGAITNKTKLLMVCHMINITGHILPIRKICDMAHSKGVEVMVDGAHAFGHITFDIKELDCDYYGSSLHKWLSVPIGAGMLYVKKEKVPDVWPLLAEWSNDPTDIKNLNHIGTHPCATDLAIGNALDYYWRLGPERKEERLRYIQRYWSDQVRDIPNIDLNTPKDITKSCGIANVGIKHIKPKELATTLMEKYKIWTVGIDTAGVRGCRITPNVYTSTKELDQFVNALKELADT